MDDVVNLILTSMVILFIDGQDILNFNNVIWTKFQNDCVILKWNHTSPYRKCRVLTKFSNDCDILKSFWAFWMTQFWMRKSHGKCSFRVYIKLIRNWLVYVNIRGRTVVTHHLTIKLRIIWTPLRNYDHLRLRRFRLNSMKSQNFQSQA